MTVYLKPDQDLSEYGLYPGVPIKVVGAFNDKYGKPRYVVRNQRGQEFSFMTSRFQESNPLPAAPVAGRKDDDGKLDMTLLDDMPRALEAVVEVMQWAVTKKKPTPYERGSWLGVHADRYRAAFKRHDLAAAKQESTCPKSLPARFQRDEETNLLHLAHQACSALMALENTLRELEENKD